MQPNTPLEQQVVSILAANREDAYETQRKRAQELSAAARALHEHFGLQKWTNLGAKHVAFLVERLKIEDTGRRTIEGRLSHLRWMVRKIGKANLLPRSNAELGIEPGPRYTRAGKFVPLAKLTEILGTVSDARLRMALLFGRHLGFRIREAMLFRPWRDWDGERVWVKRGTKGGRPRYLFLYNDRQREVLEQARALVTGDGALIPPEVPTYKRWAETCYARLRAAGMGRAKDVLFHDLRRTYAAWRMRYLIQVRGLDPEAAQRIVARELGHSRLEVLHWYLEDQDLLEAA
jgi:site-specific recombinase XerC